MKECTKCKEVKSLEDFPRNNRHKDGRSSNCKLCKRKIDNDAYANKPDRRSAIRETNQRGIDDRKRFIRDYLVNNPCVDCGEDDPIALEFDHVRGTKLANVSQLVKSNASLLSIKEEMDKCEVRCCNCHRRVTAQRGGWNLCLTDDNGSMILS